MFAVNKCASTTHCCTRTFRQRTDARPRKCDCCNVRGLVDAGCCVLDLAHTKMGSGSLRRITNVRNTSIPLDMMRYEIRLCVSWCASQQSTRQHDHMSPGRCSCSHAALAPTHDWQTQSSRQVCMHDHMNALQISLLFLQKLNLQVSSYAFTHCSATVRHSNMQLGQDMPFMTGSRHGTHVYVCLRVQNQH